MVPIVGKDIPLEAAWVYFPFFDVVKCANVIGERMKHSLVKDSLNASVAYHENGSTVKAYRVHIAAQ